MNKRDKDAGKIPKTDSKCRLCREKTEDIHHVIGSCPKMSLRYYLPLRHDVVAKTIWNTIRKEKSEATEKEEFIEQDGSPEYWWNLRIKTGTKLKHNRPDMVIWNHETKTCMVVEITCPLDINVVRKTSEKENIYGPLIRNLQMQHPRYRFKFIPIVVGATGYVPKNLVENIKELGITDDKVEKTIHTIQTNAINGTVKICKTFMKFKV